MPDAHYELPRLAAIYDITSPWSPDRDFYLSLAGPPTARVLDLGCGTGLLCDAYAAAGHDVTGAEPTPSMLEVARLKPHGGKIEWVLSSAQCFRSDKRFDLIIMTGHAFQVLLNDADIRETFEVMREHVAPGGMIAFESRNPSFDWESVWDKDRVLATPGGDVHVSSRLRGMENGRMTFEQHFRFPDETLVSTSVLRFMSAQDISERLVGSGLRVDTLLGDWNGGRFDEATSREIIFLARAAS